MNLLVLDTSTSFCSVTLFSVKKVVTRNQHLPFKHNEHILEIIEEILEEAAIKKSCLNYLAYGTGPGSFVGVRLSAAILQAMSFVLHAPIFSFSSMYAIALNAHAETKISKIVVLLKAHFSYLYCGEYLFDTNCQILKIKNEQCVKKEGVQQYLYDNQTENILIVSNNIPQMNYHNHVLREFYPSTELLFEHLSSKINQLQENFNSISVPMPVYFSQFEQWKK